jgi:oligopeptide transport system substrate-binding protein
VISFGKGFIFVRVIPRLLIILLAGTLVFGCGNAAREKDKRKVFNYNEMAGLVTLDPAAASNFETIWPVNQLYNGLVQMDDSLNVRPAIATRWQISYDGREYLFYLRNDVFFHPDGCFADTSGRKVKASDFVFSFNRLYDSRVSSATTLLDIIEEKGISMLNDSTLMIRLKRPFSAFLSMLTMKFFSVVPEEAIKRYGQDFRKHPVGTGPFMFRYWAEGVKLIMVKNPRYFEKDHNGQKLPYLDAATVSFIRDRETGFMELLNGRFDMLSGADAFNVNEVLDKEGRLSEVYTRKFFLQKATFLKTDYIGIVVDPDLDIVKRSPLRLKAIRQAVNYGFDRARLVRYLRNNVGLPAHSGFIPPGLKSFDEKLVSGYRYDPAKVRALLAEAGFPGGNGLPEMTMHISDTYKEQAEFIQSQLAANGIRMQVSVEKTSVLREASNNAEFMLFKKSWFADYPDEENFMSLFYSRNFAPKGVNFFHYRNPEFDRLFEEAQVELDAARKIKLYQQMENLVIEDAPVIPLYYDELVRLVSHKVKGLGTNPMNLLNLKTVIKE